jgi:glycosyltransferase involved in cell wall biosynthesis
MIVARSFIKVANGLEKPDIIIASMPTIELSFAATQYSKKSSRKLIIDVVDLWPDFFKDVLPKFKFVLIYPYVLYARELLKMSLLQASSITGITKSYLDWASEYIKDVQNKEFLVHPLGYQMISRSLQKANYKNKNLRIVFVGSITRQFDFETIFSAASDDRIKQIEFIIVGVGDKLHFWKEKTKHLTNVKWRGWLDGSSLNSELREADLGIMPYIKAKHFEKNITNKFSEYIAYGLPILSSIQGEMGDLILNNFCGNVYQSSEDLINKIINYSGNAELLYLESKNALKLHKSAFNIDELNTEFVSFIERESTNYK